MKSISSKSIRKDALQKERTKNKTEKTAFFEKITSKAVINIIKEKRQKSVKIILL